MVLRKTLDLIHAMLDEAKISHALIGAFALAHYGVLRATNDIDFIIESERASETMNIMLSLGFSLFHKTDEVLQFNGVVPVDFLLARRENSRQILGASSQNQFAGISVVSPEGLVGLKIQAYVNNPKRKLRDMADIQSVFEKCHSINWIKVKQYADLFSEWDTIKAIKEIAENDSNDRR